MIEIPDETKTDLGCRNLEAKAKASVANSFERFMNLLEKAVETFLEKKS